MAKTIEEYKKANPKQFPSYCQDLCYCNRKYPELRRFAIVIDTRTSGERYIGYRCMSCAHTDIDAIETVCPGCNEQAVATVDRRQYIACCTECSYEWPIKI